jgi:hypothetical protein
MTLAPHQIGDKGQRYEAQSLGYPKVGVWNTIGWSDQIRGAWDLAIAIHLNPRSHDIRVLDRTTGNYHKRAAERKE